MVEYKKVSKTYKIYDFKTIDCGNLYANVSEKTLYLSKKDGRFGLIVPISLTAAQRMATLQKLLLNNTDFLCLSNFALRPAALFPGVMQRLTICIGSKGKPGLAYTTDYITWYSDERRTLFSCMKYNLLSGLEQEYSLPKFSNQVAREALTKILNKTQKQIPSKIFDGQFSIFYHNAGGYWIKAFDFKPYYRSLVNQNKKHTTISALVLNNEALAQTYLSIMNSSLFYFFWKSITDARHVCPSDIAMFPIQMPLLDDIVTELTGLNKILMNSLKSNCQRIVYGSAEVDQYTVSPCKSNIDNIDYVLAQQYDYNHEELDYIINYDIKYRMSLTSEFVQDEDDIS